MNDIIYPIGFDYSVLVQKPYPDQVHNRLDYFARTCGYDGILSACTYAASTVPKYQSEGVYCVQSRDQTWASFYQYMDEVDAGIRPMPTSFADIVPYLPVLEWPQ